MRLIGRGFVVVGMALSVGCHAPAQSQTRALKVVELFTSQGCSSCPPANANLTILSRREDVLALSYGVDYWDYLGWNDIFASPAFTQRQRDYARTLRLRAVYTPQMVINGRADLVGARMGDVDRSLARAGAISGGPTLSVRGNLLSLGAMTTPAHSATVWLVTYDPNVVQVPIARGENGGKTLPHVNVVRSLTRIGEYQGMEMTVTLPATRNPALRSAILVQMGMGGPIVAATRL